MKTVFFNFSINQIHLHGTIFMKAKKS